MPPSVPNLTGSSDAAKIPYGNHRSFPREMYPQYGGHKSVIYRSSDGKVVAGAALESGSGRLTYPCDEFLYVTEGVGHFKVEGGDSFTLTKGDCLYLTKGTTIDFDLSPDFWNVAVFVDSERITQF